MSLGVDEHASRRAELPAPVRELCGRAGVVTGTGVLLPPRFGRGTGTVLALRHAAGNGSWDVSVTVVRARRLHPSAGRASAGYSRDPRSGYDLNSPGELAHEVQVHEEDDGGSGHGPRPLVVFELTGTPQATADVLTLWACHGSLFAWRPPGRSPGSRPAKRSAAMTTGRLRRPPRTWTPRAPALRCCVITSSR